MPKRKPNNAKLPVVNTYEKFEAKVIIDYIWNRDRPLKITPQIEQKLRTFWQAGYPPESVLFGLP